MNKKKIVKPKKKEVDYWDLEGLKKCPHCMGTGLDVKCNNEG